jgi:diguanylate cyclase (GGDEF)-like protein
MLFLGRLCAVAVVACVPLLFGLTAVGIAPTGVLDWLATWASAGAFAAAAALCFARGGRAERSTWTWFGIACTCWAAANLYYALIVAPDPLPLPSLADIGYFSFPIAICAGLVQYARTQGLRISTDLWLDGLVAALGTAAVMAAVVFELGHATTGDFGRVVTSLVYPLEDVAVIGVFVGVWSLMGWRADRTLSLIAVAVAAITTADVIVFSRVLSGSTVGGAWPNVGWTLGVALLAAAAHRGGGRRREAVDASGRQHLVLPVAFAGAALVVLALSSRLHFNPAATIFAVAALAVSCARLFRSFRDVRALADSHRLAVTDELTGLPNRRRLLADLEAACAEGSSCALALFDLDGFKRFNDTYGHPEGDHLLARLAHGLASAVAPGATAYRLGGDEFCVLTTATPAGRLAIDAAGEALTETGLGWSVTASFGVVEIPREATTVSEAMRVADRRMYAQKDRRPAAARQQALDVLLSALGEQQPTLRAHADDVTALTRVVAVSLGMTPDDADDVARAAELHDVGKLAIPREILEKPGPLDDSEWEIMRRHTIVGERMLSAAPALSQIAPLVRSSHERWDGGGYPDGLAGEDIPLGARIVAVCDSFDAMVADRPYRAGMSVREALAELRRCAGTQFDPRVVDAFLDALVHTEAGAMALAP